MVRYIKCGQCGCVEPATAYQYGRGRQFGEHPDHRYCPHCAISIDWFGGEYVPQVAQAEMDDFLAAVAWQAPA